MISKEQYEVLRDLVGLAEASGWASKSEVKLAKEALAEIPNLPVRGVFYSPAVPGAQAQYLDDRITALERRLDQMQSTYLEHYSEAIRRDRTLAYGIARHISEFSDETIFAEAEERRRKGH